VAEVQRDNTLKQTTLLGYAKIDFLHMDLHFGRWNLRDIDEGEVLKFVLKMRTGKGLIRYVADTIVPLVISKEAVDLTLLKPELDLGADVLHPLVITDPQATVYAVGGQHRRAALQTFKDEYAQQIAALTRKMVQTKDAAKLAAHQEEMMKLKAHLAGVGFWGVAVYDLGKLVFPLSQRSTKLQ
jgi:hypothetical protein